MLVQHLTHQPQEWYDAIDSDPDCDFETGEYIGFSDMIKLSDGRWYPQTECRYINENGEIRQCK